MMIAGTEWMPASVYRRSRSRVSAANSSPARISRARAASSPASVAARTSTSMSEGFWLSVK
ncbi:hypothetical protein D3C86_601530 [compost metagenome]